MRILYLANYAPEQDGDDHSVDPSEAFYFQYHGELATRFEEIGLRFVSSRSLDHLIERGREYNYVFSVYNRAPFRNSEIFPSAVCEYHRIAYLGARPHVRALAEDKALTKSLARSVGVPTPDWATYNVEDQGIVTPDFEGPYIVKPRFEAGSRCIDPSALCHEWDEAEARTRELHSRGMDVILERFIPGKNVTQPVISHLEGSWVPSPFEIRSREKGNIITYRQKRDLDTNVRREIFDRPEIGDCLADYVSRLRSLLKPIDYFRADFRIEEESDTPHLLELNVCCNLSPEASIGRVTHSEGVEHRQLIEHILAYSIRRQKVLR